MLRRLVVVCALIVALFTVALASTPVVQARDAVPPDQGTAPYISDFLVCQVAGVAGTYTMSGHVINNPPPGTTVTITGVAGTKTLTVNADGSFSGTVYVAPGTTGGVDATAQTPSGQSSNTRTDLLI